MLKFLIKATWTPKETYEPPEATLEPCLGLDPQRLKISLLRLIFGHSWAWVHKGPKNSIFVLQICYFFGAFVDPGPRMPKN